MMTTESDPDGASAGEAVGRSRLGIGCGVVFGAGLAGLCLTVAQVAVLHATWTSCELGGPVGDDFPGGAAYTWFLADVARFAFYAAVFLAAVVGGRRWIESGGRVGAGLRTLVVVVLCAVAFGADLAWGIRMDPGTFNPARCPGGVPHWWPF